MSITKQQIEQLKRNAANDALQALNSGCVVLDTETTGLDEYAEIIELAAIGADGETLFNELIMPVFCVPEEAAKIHGITTREVNGRNSCCWFNAASEINIFLADRVVAIYNASYDARLLRQTAKINSLFCNGGRDCKQVNYQSSVCVMKMYAAFWGDWNEEKNSFRWQKLTNAAEQQGIKFEGKAHRALADAKATLELLKRMADYADKLGGVAL